MSCPTCPFRCTILASAPRISKMRHAVGQPRTHAAAAGAFLPKCARRRCCNADQSKSRAPRYLLSQRGELGRRSCRCWPQSIRASRGRAEDARRGRQLRRGAREVRDARLDPAAVQGGAQEGRVTRDGALDTDCPDFRCRTHHCPMARGTPCSFPASSRPTSPSLHGRGAPIRRLCRSAPKRRG